MTRVRRVARPKHGKLCVRTPGRTDQAFYDALSHQTRNQRRPCMARYSGPAFDTLALHAGAAPDPSTGARAAPIHLSTSFVFESSDHAAALFNLERSGHVYSRISNPTNAVLEQRVSALEEGIGAIT